MKTPIDVYNLAGREIKPAFGDGPDLLIVS